MELLIHTVYIQCLLVHQNCFLHEQQKIKFALWLLVLQQHCRNQVKWHNNRNILIK